MLATINWINPSGGNWNTASNWRDSSNVNRVPGTGDNVVIPDIGAAGADQIITFNTGAVAVSSITSAEQLSVTAGTLTDNGNLAGSGQLLVAGGTFSFGGTNWNNTGSVILSNGTLNLGGSFTTAGLGSYTRSGGVINLKGTLDNTGGTLALDTSTGSWNLSGGTLTGSALATANGTSLAATNLGGTLSGLTLGATVAGQAEPGTLSVVSGGLSISNGLTLASNTVVVVQAGGGISLVGNQTVGGTGAFAFTGQGGNLGVFGALTLGPGVTVHGSGGSLFISSGSLTNQGTIAADGGGTVTVGSAGFSLTNAAGGTLAANGGTLSLDGTWSNAGQIVVNNSTLNLFGSFTTAGLGSYTRSGGVINLHGTLDNTGAALALSTATGSWNLAGGTINGGALATADGTTLAATNIGGTLSGLTLGATVAGQAEPGNVSVVSGGVSFSNGLTLANNTVVQIGDTSFGGEVDLVGTETLGGSGAFAFAGVSGTLSVQGAVTLGPGVTVHGTSGTLVVTSGTLTNRGTIAADGGGTITLNVGSGGTSWSNAAGGTLAANGGTLSLNSAWSNAGQIVVNNSTLNLGGSFTTAGLGSYTRSFGVINLTGILDNTGATLALNSATGSWNLAGGTITGGTVSTSGNATLIVARSFFSTPSFVNSVTLAGIIDDALFSAALTITNGLTLNNGTIQVAGRNLLNFVGSQTLGGTGTVSLASLATIGGLLVPNAGDHLTIAPGIFVSGHGLVGSTTGGAVTSNGTVSANDGGALIVQGATNFANGTLTGGTWQASNNSTLRIIGAQIATNAANVLLSGSNSHIYSDAATTNAFSSLSANAAQGQFTVTGGASLVETASLTNSGSLTLGPNSTLTVAGFTQGAGSTVLAGGTLATSQPGGLAIQAGTLSGPGTIQGNVINAGAIDAGLAPGTLVVTGNYAQTAAGVLNVKLGGTTPETQYDQVKVSGSASLGGTLDIQLINGFGPSAGQTFQVLSFAVSNGNFATINGLVQNNLATLQPVLNPTNLTLLAVSTAPDLAPTIVTTPPGTAVPGQPITINFTVQNRGGTALSGDWVDSVFLSSSAFLDASAVRIGQVAHTGGLGGNLVYSSSLTAPLPAVPDGHYFVLVEADSQKLIGDSNRSNNVLASSALTVTIPSLALGTPVSGTIASGQDVYYRVTVLPGADVLFEAQFSAATEADFLVSQFQIPTRSIFDLAYPNLADPKQDLLLPGSQAGVDYILLHGREGAGCGQPYTLEAQAAPFAIQSFTALDGPGKDLTSLELSGAGFTPQTTVRLLNINNATFAPVSVTFVDAEHLTAAFDLNQVPLGSYDVQAVEGAATATAPTSFDNFPPPLVATVDPSITYSTPAFIRVGGSVVISLTITNDSNRNELVPMLVLQGTNVELLENPLPVDLFGASANGGLLPYLRPGYSGDFVFGAPAQPAQIGVESTIAFGTVNLEAPINWASQEAALRPVFIAPDAWHAIYANLTPALGKSPADMQQTLSNDSLYLAQLGEHVTTLSPHPKSLLEKSENRPEQLPSPPNCGQAAETRSKRGTSGIDGGRTQGSQGSRRLRDQGACVRGIGECRGCSRRPRSRLPRGREQGVPRRSGRRIGGAVRPGRGSPGFWRGR